MTPSTEVTVRPMTPGEYDRWQHELAVGYAAEKVRAGNWAEDGVAPR